MEPYPLQLGSLHRRRGNYGAELPKEECGGLRDKVAVGRGEKGKETSEEGREKEKKLYKHKIVKIVL